MELTCERETFIPTRQSLLSRLRDWRDDASWEDFFQTYWRLIYNTAMRAGLNEAQAQDVVQETIIAVSKNIKEFEYNPKGGSFKSWLLNQTRWRIADQLRNRNPHDSIEHIAAEAHEGTHDALDRLIKPEKPELEQIWDTEWDRNILEIAFERVKQRVDSKNFQIFDLHVLREWPVAKVAKTAGVSVLRVYMAKHRVSAALRHEIKTIQSRTDQIK